MKDDRVYLRHILRCISRIEEYTGAGRETFFSAHLIQDGVIRNLQTLAESSQRLSHAIKAEHPTVDWKGLAGFRNVLVHDYLKDAKKRPGAELSRHKSNFDFRSGSGFIGTM